MSLLFLAMKNCNYSICGSEKSICEEILEELQRVPSIVRSILIHIGRIAAAKGRSQHALMELAQAR